jgi:AraC-like DNA-binding protein
VLETIFPRSDLLKKYVRYIYQFSSDDPNFERQLVIFPNVGSAIAVYKNVDFFPENDQQFLSREKQGSSGVILHLNRIDPITIKEEGRQKRIVIVLKPLGINQFMNEPPGELLKINNPSLVPVSSFFSELKEFSTGPEMEQPLHKSAEIIEELLSERFKHFTNPILENAINEVDKADKLSKIEDIAYSVGASTKTMKRLFHKYIGLSPVEFRKIAQFRNALRNKLANQEASFTSIAWENSYYDLPYMIKVFKELTGISIKEFFSRLSYSGDMQYVYIG